LAKGGEESEDSVSTPAIASSAELQVELEELKEKLKFEGEKLGEITTELQRANEVSTSTIKELERQLAENRANITFEREVRDRDRRKEETENYERLMELVKKKAEVEEERRAREESKKNLTSALAALQKLKEEERQREQSLQTATQHIQDLRSTLSIEKEEKETLSLALEQLQIHALELEQREEELRREKETLLIQHQEQQRVLEEERQTKKEELSGGVVTTTTAEEITLPSIATSTDSLSSSSPSLSPSTASTIPSASSPSVTYLHPSLASQLPGVSIASLPPAALRSLRMSSLLVGSASVGPAGIPFVTCAFQEQGTQTENTEDVERRLVEAISKISELEKSIMTSSEEARAYKEKAKKQKKGRWKELSS
jgi:hypothetical protein